MSRCPLQVHYPKWKQTSRCTHLTFNGQPSLATWPMPRPGVTWRSNASSHGGTQVLLSFCQHGSSLKKITAPKFNSLKMVPKKIWRFLLEIIIFRFHVKLEERSSLISNPIDDDYCCQLRPFFSELLSGGEYQRCLQQTGSSENSEILLVVSFLGCYDHSNIVCIHQSAISNNIILQIFQAWIILRIFCNNPRDPIVPKVNQTFTQ